MSDPTPVVPVPAGKTTSEFTLTKVMMAIGAVVAFLGAGLAAFPPAAAGPVAPYLGIAAMVIGMAGAYFKAKGYNDGRVELKAAALGTTAAQSAPQLLELFKAFTAAAKTGDAPAAPGEPPAPAPGPAGSGVNG